MVANGRERDRCRQAREWASLRLDGELSELERLLLRRHLGRCAECRAFAEAAEAVTRAIRQAPAEEPSRRLAPEARAGEPRHSRRRRLVAAGVLVAASAAAGAVIGGFVASDGRTPPQAPTQIVQLPEPPTTSTTPTGNV
jgi:predicted anti-sigma-YlaC factor YlaD